VLLKSRLGGIADVLEDHNFQRYSVGALTSWLSFFIQASQCPGQPGNLTHSTRWLATVALMDAVPNIVLMPLGGVSADRHDRFRILLFSYALAWLQAVALTLLAWSGQLNIALLAGLAFFHGAVHAFSIPVQFGVLPRFVEPRRLSSAISVAAAYTQLGIFVGPALAGWVIVHFGTAIAFATNVVGYGVYFGCVTGLRTPAHYQQPRASDKAFVSDFLDGLRAIAAHSGMRAMVVLMLLADMLGSAVRQMAPALSERMLNAGVEALTTLLAASGIGATFAALWLARGGAECATPRNCSRPFFPDSR
jgi:MFS family permease